MKIRKRLFAAFLALLLLVNTVPLSALAAEPNTPKEEVVYVNLNHDGSVKEIRVVNIFELDKDGKIIDYGKYESLKNMTTTDPITENGDVITIDTKAGKLYYEGLLKTTVMPWDISIKYFMNDKEYSAEEIAGMSGALKIKMDITENQSCDGNYFESYALQTTFKLDTKKCKNIVAPEATHANVGSAKQLTYTILPNKGANIEITADVTDFELESIAVNGIKLNLQIDIDTAQFTALIDQVSSAVAKLNDGASELKNGSSQLSDATGLLDSNVEKLHSGVGLLNDGSSELSNGLSAISAQSETLRNGAYTAFQGLCTAAQGVINSQLEEKGMAAVTLTPATYEAVLLDLLNQLDEDKIYQKAYDIAFETVTKEVNARADEVYMGYIETIADSIYRTYLESQGSALYKQAVATILKQQKIDGGSTEEEAEEFINSAMGQIAITMAVNKLTAEQKVEIVENVLAMLTEDQKLQIREGAVATLTDDQKTQIREGYIDQMMKSEEVTSQITDAVKAAGSAAVQIADLKGQLDNFSVFYKGVCDYTSAVDTAANGAKTIAVNMKTLHENTAILETSCKKLDEAMKQLYGGTTELKDGTNTFANATSGISGEVDSKIDSMIDSIAGGDEACTSFVSERNTNVKAVQFVIKTETLAAANAVEDVLATEEVLTFWQKLLRLFGLY